MTTTTLHDFNIANPFDANSSTSAVSTQAEKLKNSAVQAFSDFMSSSITRTNEFANREDILEQELLTLFIQCKKANWDGYNASPVTMQTLMNAQKFLASLDEEQLCNCEMSPEPDGEVAFEWYGDNGGIFSISIGNTNKLTFAGHFGNENKINGVHDFGQLDKKFIKSLTQMVR